MKLAGWASFIHKWLALIVGVQVLLWVASGLFFAIFPIERVRSEHRMAVVAAPLALAEVIAPSALSLAEPPAKLSLERGMDGPVYVAEFAEAPSLRFDARNGRRLSPLDAQMATRVAQAHLRAPPSVASVERVVRNSPEYRGPLPAWRVAFVDNEGLAVYVAADTGRVIARRSDLWRVYDALWALHIMDWRDHENFNTGLLIWTSVATLVVILAGIILFPYRLRLARFGRGRKSD